MSEVARARDASALVLGIGCMRGTSEERLSGGIREVLAAHGLALASVRAVATVDDKRDEPGLTALCARHGWPLTTYSAAQLRAFCSAAQPCAFDSAAQPCAFDSAAQLRASMRDASRDSEVVAQHVGTPAVAEPAACLRAGAAVPLVPKTAYGEPGGPRFMTIAIARLESEETAHG